MTSCRTDVAMRAWADARAAAAGFTTPKRRRPTVGLGDPGASFGLGSPSGSEGVTSSSPTSSVGGTPTCASKTHSWCSPGPLKECPFDVTSPCCSKKYPCYKYFDDLNIVKGWRNDYLFNDKETREETRDKLHAHRERRRSLVTSPTVYSSCSGGQVGLPFSCTSAIVTGDSRSVGHVR